MTMLPGVRRRRARPAEPFERIGESPPLEPAADGAPADDAPFPSLRASFDYVVHETNPPWRVHRPRWLTRRRPPPPPAYRLPRLMMLRVAYTSVRGRRRDVQRDTLLLTSRMQPQPAVCGAEHLPTRGPCVIIPNHYERPDGAWVGWGAIVIAAALARERPTLPAVRWVMTSTWQDCYLGPLRVPPHYLTWVLRRFAAMYGLILMPAQGDETFARGRALRALFRVLDDPAGQVVALHPEAGGFETLIAPPRGMGRVLAAIDRRGIPLIPTGVFEVEGRLIVHFGPPLPRGALAARDDDGAIQTAMLAIARLLPPANRGVYAACCQSSR